MLETAAAKWSMATLLALVALLAPIHGVMGAVGFLIGADFITGVVAAHKRGEKITSRAMSRTIYKIIGYQLAVVSGFALETLLPGELPVAKLCAAAIGLVEVTSLFENVKSITGLDLSAVLSKIQKRDGDE